MIPSYKNCIIIFLKCSHLSYTSHFKVWTSSLYLMETLAMQAMKITVCFFQISHFAPDIFIKVLKYAKWWCHKIWIKYDEERYFSQFASEISDSLQWDSSNCALYNELCYHGNIWVRDFPDIEGFWGHFFGIAFWCLPVVPHLYDQPSI